MIYRSIRELIEDQLVVSITPDVNVHQAAVLMATHRIGALPVMRGTDLIGIFTERDLVSRVVAPRLDPERTPVVQVMTATPETVTPDQPLYEALNQMHDHGFRHLPVMNGEHVVGMLSLRDIPAEYRLMREKWLEAHQPLDTAAA